MIMEREEVINGIRKDGQKVGEDNFPIEIFPQLIQSIILTFNRDEKIIPSQFFSLGINILKRTIFMIKTVSAITGIAIESYCSR